MQTKKPQLERTENSSRRGFDRSNFQLNEIGFLNVFDIGRQDRLLQKARAGDRDSFDALWNLHSTKLNNWLLRKGTHADVDDVLQEASLAAWQGLNDFQGRSGFKTWLFSIAEYKLFESSRRRKSDEIGAGDLTAEEADQHSTRSYDRIDLQLDVSTGLSLLSESQHRVVTLYFYDGLTLAEIGQQLDKNLNTVKYQFYSGLKIIEIELQKEHSR